ncbi:MAG: ABC transporter substrate binding protein, partial [Candidatus Nucleicultricaceae bacterium]
ISKPADLSLVFLKLAAVVDAIYVPLDNTIVALMPQLSALALQKGIPLIAADSGSVRQGALATYGFSYTDCGNEAGLYMLDILQGNKINDLPIKTPKDQGIYINKKTAEALHLTLDLKKLGTLKEVIE